VFPKYWCVAWFFQFEQVLIASEFYSSWLVRLFFITIAVYFSSLLRANSFLADRDIHDMTNKGIIDYNTHFIRVLLVIVP